MQVYVYSKQKLSLLEFKTSILTSLLLSTYRSSIVALKTSWCYFCPVFTFKLSDLSQKIVHTCSS